jgi:hypothetical protein
MGEFVVLEEEEEKRDDVSSRFRVAQEERLYLRRHPLLVELEAKLVLTW